MANSMRALTPILGDSIGSIGNLAERLVFMKQSMKAVELSGAATGAAISGGITLAVSAAAMLVEAWQKAEEEQRQAFEEAKQALAQYTEELREAEQAAKALDNQTSSVSDLTAARQDLADLFPNIVLGYDEEGKAILANNQALEQELELLKKKTKINREIMASGTYDSIKNYHKYS